MTEISEDRIEKLWEWCGWRRRLSASENPHYWMSPEGQAEADLPPLDLNNLSKWAVPRLENDWQLTIKIALGLTSVTLDECSEEDVRKQVFIVNLDLVTALVLAIERLIEEGK